MKENSIVHGNVRTILLVQECDRLAQYALEYAMKVSKDITLFCVAENEQTQKELICRFSEWNPDIPCVIRRSSDGRIVDPLLQFIHSSEFGGTDRDRVTVILPILVSDVFWHRFLSNSGKKYIVRQLMRNRNLSITLLPYHLFA